MASSRPVGKKSEMGFTGLKPIFPLDSKLLSKTYAFILYLFWKLIWVHLNIVHAKDTKDAYRSLESGTKSDIS